MQVNDIYALFLENPSVETDTRKLKKGDIFFALKGPNYNGNHYTQQALQAGASYCIADEPSDNKDDRIILVENCLSMLQQLAKKHRQQFNIPFIAITGSNGKTTTKELLQQVISSSYKSYTTLGNLNNHIGVPLTILRIKQDAEIAIIEMGANHQKEIEGYCEYTMPTHGIITNIGKAHLEGFGGEEGIKKGKGELFEYLKKNAGTAFINNDSETLIEISKGIKEVITYGTINADYTGIVQNDESYLQVKITKGANLPLIKSQLIGNYNLPNILAAVCVGKYFNVPDNKIKDAIESYTPSNSRSQLIKKDSNEIILDAYNANPSSMKAAIENFAKMKGDKKILILGSMMELGADSDKEHEGIISLIKKYNWEDVVLTGDGFKDIPDGFLHFTFSTEAAKWFKQKRIENTLVLIKGSRSMQMEKVLE
ncbi:MAG: UDP-N-acetylmuramoyl-tripeptide--D-alanyl-D-alanine ligase [Bacteroidetes bacterium]|nr:UDP-N-acetylmuramoyl-tripeptide--D-alanyl-D-alanine ligase [Bacteroidota bacterium]MBS1757028.1 UDP-N-acetylmuramoyl-tripeptide--D-alanyl-D-alanine ligase [Bacteroidota bacterium]